MIKEDIEIIEKIVYKSTDEIAVDMARCFERLDEKMSNILTSIRNRLEKIENKL